MHVPPQLGPDGEIAPRWCELPMFCRVGDHFASYFNRLHIEQTQQFPDAPRITPEQAAAVDAVEEVGRIPEPRLEMPLQPGDLQVVNNLSVAHARTAYDGDATGKGRLLLRMHAAFGGSPELPSGYAAIFGSSTAGTYRGGLWQTPEVREMFGTPLPMTTSPGPAARHDDARPEFRPGRRPGRTRRSRPIRPGHARSPRSSR